MGRRAILNMVAGERHKTGRRKRMSMILWDMFTGSASYRNILMRTLHPLYLQKFIRCIIGAALGSVFRPLRQSPATYDEIDAELMA